MVTKVGRRQLNEADILAIAGGGGPGSPQPVISVFGRQGNVVAVASDYDASQIDNDSFVVGITVSDALNTLLADVGDRVDTAGDTVFGNLTMAGSPQAKILINSGSASAPSLAFSGDADTGLYRSAANEINIATGGTSRIAVADANTTFTTNALFNLPPFIRYNSASANNPGYGQIYAGAGTLTYRDASGTDYDMISGGGGGDPDQNLWETISSDSGSVAANTTTDTLTIAGGTSISTSVSGDTVTITNDAPNVTQTITLTGDVTGSGTGSFATVVGNDTHSHTGATISALDAGDTTTGTFANGRISEASVTQHEAALSIAFSQITGTVDADTLDGIDSLSFLRSNAADTKTSGNLTFNDNIQANFGTGNDAELYATGSNLQLDLNSSGVTSFLVRDGTTTRFTFARSSGDFTATGDVTGNSDIRLKKNLEIIPNSLEKVEQLTGYTYNLKTEDGRRRVGVVAQEVEQVLPEAVLEDAEGIKSVAYGNMVALLIEAVKDLSGQVNELKAEIEELK